LDVREKNCWFNPQITGAWPIVAVGSIPFLSRYGSRTRHVWWCRILGVVGLDPAPLKTWKDADVIWVVLNTPPETYPETMAY
jgi:hypothetical protein